MQTKYTWMSKKNIAGKNKKETHRSFQVLVAGIWFGGQIK